ncbi:MAG: hypothetical protein IJX76_01085 [Clostridia bacterium]|nr:hypothetical protein [Clostridia bacterium]
MAEIEGKGRKADQKMKPFLVYEYLMRASDASHVACVNDIVGYLQECGISAERRSIYKDINEINKAILLTTRDHYGIPLAETIEEAEELLQDEENRTIIYDEHRKGYYVRKRHYKVDGMRLFRQIHRPEACQALNARRLRSCQRTSSRNHQA